MKRGRRKIEELGDLLDLAVGAVDVFLVEGPANPLRRGTLETRLPWPSRVRSGAYVERILLTSSERL